MARNQSFWDERWVEIRERMSTGTRLMGAKVFLHSRIVVNAVVVSRSSREIVSNVKL